MNPLLLISAFILDLVFGDPEWMPHPVRLIGRSIRALENVLRRVVVPKIGPKGAGVLLTVIIVLSSYAATFALISLATSLHANLGVAVGLYLAYTTLAMKSLSDEAKAVLASLKIGLTSARSRFSRIVGRETETLNEDAVIRATVETVAENSSDGVIAPLFYLALGGAPLAIAYKALNTLDSTVGYKTERYVDFGWASARCDDWANYLPARLTGLLMVGAAGLCFQQGQKSLTILRRDGHKHDSPNAGIPEAATAGALGIQLGGPSFYDGLLKEKPWLGDATNTLRQNHIGESIRLMRTSSVLMLMLSLSVLAL